MKFLCCILCVAVLSACGGDGSGYSDDTPGPAPDPGANQPPSEPDAEWDAVKPAIVRACGNCHNGVKQAPDLTKKASFQAAKAKVKARIEAGTMPPSGSPFAPADKRAILEYL